MLFSRNGKVLISAGVQDGKIKFWKASVKAGPRRREEQENSRERKKQDAVLEDVESN